MKRVTRCTVNTHRQCAAYPPGLGVNSKVGCRRRKRRRKKGQHINSVSIKTMQFVFVKCFFLACVHAAVRSSYKSDSKLVLGWRFWFGYIFNVRLYLDSIVVTVSGVQTSQTSYLALGPGPRRFFWRGCMFCIKQNKKTVQKFRDKLQFLIQAKQRKTKSSSNPTQA